MDQPGVFSPSSQAALTASFESFRSHPYRDTQNKLTVGYGTNLDAGLSEPEARFLLQYRLGVAREHALELFDDWFPQLDAPRQYVVVDMIYNLGVTGFLGFKRLRGALAAKDYKAASLHMLDSVWALQVKSRAYALARIMDTGEMPAGI